MADGRINSTINQLGAFTNEVFAQRGKKIAEAAADDLIAQAQAIIALLFNLSLNPTPLPLGEGTATPTLANTETPLPTDTPTELPTLTPTFSPRRR